MEILRERKMQNMPMTNCNVSNVIRTLRIEFVAAAGDFSCPYCRFLLLTTHFGSPRNGRVLLLTWTAHIFNAMDWPDDCSSVIEWEALAH